MKKSLVTGVTAGAAMGAATGSAINKDERGKGAGQGALVGALIGGLTSYFIHGTLNKRDSKVRKDTLLNLDKFNVTDSSKAKSNSGVENFKLSAPDIDKECFDWEIKSGKLVQKHCVWTIRGNSFWTPVGR